jgi:hypothetical protein
VTGLLYIALILILSLVITAFTWRLRLRLIINNTDCIIEGDIMLFGAPVFKRVFHLTFIQHKLKLYILGRRIRKKKHKKKKRSKIKAGDIISGIKFKKLELFIKAGAGRADKTALVCGALYSALSFAVLKIKNNSKVAVQPDFNNGVFLLEGECIIKVKVLHIICKLLFK